MRQNITNLCVTNSGDVFDLIYVTSVKHCDGNFYASHFAVMDTETVTPLMEIPVSDVSLVAKLKYFNNDRTRVQGAISLVQIKDEPGNGRV